MRGSPQDAQNFADLLRLLIGDPRLDLELTQVLPRLALEPVGKHLFEVALGRSTQTLRVFLGHPFYASNLSEKTLLKALQQWLLMPSPVLAPALPAEVDAFDDLAQALRAHPSSGGLLVNMLAQVKLKPKVRQRLLKVGLKYELTVDQFLSEADEIPWPPQEFYAVLDAFSDWTNDQLSAPVTTPRQPSPSNVIPLRPALTVEAVKSHLVAIGLPGLQLWSQGMLEGTPNATPGRSLSELLYQGDRLDLDQRLTRFEQRLEVLRATPLPRPALSPDPLLARLQQAALDVRERLVPTWPRGLAGSRCGVRAHDTTLVVMVHLWGSPYEHVFRLDDFFAWPGAPDAHCECGVRDCAHLVALLDFFGGRFLDDDVAVKVLRGALRPGWERLLEAMVTLPAKAEPSQGALSFEVSGNQLATTFHSLNKRGEPTKVGKRVHDVNSILSRLGGVDHRIAERLAVTQGGARGSGDRMGAVALLLEGHPRVRWVGHDTYLPVERIEGRVKFEDSAEGFALTFLVGDLPWAPETRLMRRPEGGALAFLQDGTRRIVLAQVGEPFLRLVAATQQLGATLPREAVPRLVEVLPGLEAAAMVELPEELRGEEVASQARLVVRVAASGTGLALSIRVEPLARGPLFVPGHGVPVSATFDGQRRTFARRRFEEEVSEANALASTLGLDPTVAPEPYLFPLDATAPHLEALRRLSNLEVSVEWQAPRVKFTAEATLDRLRLSISRTRDWFGLDGEVTVDDRRVALAALLEAARDRRRFVKLGEGDYAQLSEALLDQLAPLAHLALPGKRLELTPGAAPLIEALAPHLEGLEVAREWKELLARLEQARTATFPEPKALKATLRDYQKDGYQWLSRLAQWGTGACLADDMGLGKTLQALAFLVSRAKQGPALVVAPSSVLHTWRNEARAFAPTLKIHLFHEGERSLSAFKAGDVVVVSWALLAREAELFASPEFATVVFDEAHAIKNAGTLRSKAAHQVKAGFVVALSGTPIENHVGELWSLFRVVMPSLLGSEESFRARFGSGDPVALSSLATLVRPFILRRTKGAVARELPPKTEVELVVPLSSEERALYDDVRLSAASDLESVTGESKRFDVLAALTRLRLTACHPRLVDAQWKGPTSKLARLLELVDDLRAAGHRALVFSQFTKHLGLVAEALRKKGVAFVYLDGQVAVAERQRRVEAFQRGEGGDLFLISIKAGGTGLTLTAADYVIHLDPWWNPAVEDQASDRAHRMGQDKPVTVYRLIAEGTIEQQILSMHREKRELVDALLQGADMAGKLSTAQLADLIRGGPSVP